MLESGINNAEDCELADLITEYTKDNVNAKVDDDKLNVVRCHKNNIDSSRTNAIEKVLFGDKAQLINNLKRAINKKETLHQHIKNKDDDDIKDEEEAKIISKCNKRDPVWKDSDDESLLYQVKKSNLDHSNGPKLYKEYLAKKFTRIHNEPKWVTLAKIAKENGRKKQKFNKEDASSEDSPYERETKDNDDGDELLRTVGFLNKNVNNVNLPSHHIKVKVLKDLNRATYAEGRINCIDFHPTSTTALVVGENCIASIYAVDGINNDKLHNIYIPNFPIKCAKILPCGTKAILGSATRCAYMYDLLTAQEASYTIRRDYGSLETFKVAPCGKYFASCGLDGNVHLWEAKSFELIHTFRQNDNCSNMCFSNDSPPRLITNGKSSNVYIFSIRQRRLEHRFIDDGCISGSVIDLSANQRLLATGSMEGAVNVYDFQKIIKTLPPSPKPDKIFLNLKTAISDVKFNFNSELLGFCSNKIPNAVKLAHFPSATVYANFPIITANTKLGKIQTLCFSPQSGFMALGTFKSAPLFRLKHYENY